MPTLQSLRSISHAKTLTGGLTDTELLARFATHADQYAFTALMARHGPMVLAICRRQLSDVNDADDAFQACFLTLALKATKLRPDTQLGAWLYGVAVRTARRLRVAATRRRIKERSAAQSRPEGRHHPTLTGDVGVVVDEELARLPDRIRAAVIACDLQQLSRHDAAQMLGWAEGTLSSRLSRGRRLLVGRLLRRGIAPVLTLAVVPERLSAAVTTAAVRAVRGELRAAVSSTIYTLCTQGTNPMTWLKIFPVAVAVTASLAVGVFAAWQPVGDSAKEDRPLTDLAKQPPPKQPADQGFTKTFTLNFPDPDQPGTLNVDIQRGTITVEAHDKDDVIVELTVPQSADATRPGNPDFEVRQKGNEIKVDSNDQRYVLTVNIKVPKRVNLILDTYRDGGVVVTGVTGDLDLRSQNSDIRATGVSGNLKAYSYNGSVTATFTELPEGAAVSMESYNGDLDLTLPAKTLATLKYLTGKGKFTTDFSFQPDEPETVVEEKSGVKTMRLSEFVRGEVNGGGRLVTLETENGNIHIRKPKP